MDKSQLRITTNDYQKLCQLMAECSRILVNLGHQLAPPVQAKADQEMAAVALKEVIDQHPGRAWLARELYAQLPGFGERLLGRAATQIGMTRKITSKGTLLIPTVDPSQPI